MKSSAAIPFSTVMVVDDDHGVRLLAGQILEKAGFTSYRLRGGWMLELLSTLVPDVLVIDIAMPEMDGIELALRFAVMAGAFKRCS